MNNGCDEFDECMYLTFQSGQQTFKSSCSCKTIIISCPLISWQPNLFYTGSTVATQCTFYCKCSPRSDTKYFS